MLFHCAAGGPRYGWSGVRPISRGEVPVHNRRAGVSPMLAKEWGVSPMKCRLSPGCSTITASPNVWRSVPSSRTINSSPVWLVNDKRVRLSLLQLVARLPRAEVFTGRQDADDPVWVRFSGGRVALAMDKRLTMFSREIFQPYRDGWTGERVERPGKFLGVKSHLKDWPPADLSDV